MGRILVIGSQALKANHVAIGRMPADMDIIATYDDTIEFAKVFHKGVKYTTLSFDDGQKFVSRSSEGILEAEIAWAGSNQMQLLDLRWDQAIHGEFGVRFASLDVLYALKMSHRYKKNSPHFLKTMRDIQAIRKYYNPGQSWGNPILKDWYARREAETYSYSHPKLNQTKREFFNPIGADGQPLYRYDHDSIHEAVKISHQPAYKYYSIKGQEVLSSREKFMAQPRYIQLYGVLEESYVLALERSQIPFAGKVSHKESFDMALEKVCTSITSGWFREFAWENYDAVQNLYIGDYVDKFNTALSRGVIRPFIDKTTLVPEF
jgi:hypothetical protein